MSPSCVLTAAVLCLILAYATTRWRGPPPDPLPGV